MPVYEYKCRDCGHTSEALRPMRDADAAMACEDCGSGKTKRIHSVFAAATQEADRPAPTGDCSQCCSADGSCPYKQ